MSIKNLINVPDISEKTKQKILKETSLDRFFSHRLYVGRMAGKSLHALRTDVMSAIWEYQPNLIFWEDTGFSSILANYEKSEYYLPNYLRNQNFFEYIKTKTTEPEPYIIIINAPLGFENCQGLFDSIKSIENKNIYFWVNTHRVYDSIPKNMFFINAFKNYCEEELNRLMPNNRLERISNSSPENEYKCCTSDNTIKIYENMTTEEIIDIINVLKWYK